MIKSPKKLLLFCRPEPSGYQGINRRNNAHAASLQLVEVSIAIIVTYTRFGMIKLRGKYSNWQVLIDSEDLELVSRYKWWGCQKKCGSKTVYAQVNRKTILLHRLIMGATPGQIVDHINRNPLDNRKENLRICTARQNSQNMSIKNANTSGFPGVDWETRAKRWRVTIRVNGKKKYIGRFILFEDAVSASVNARKKYHGEFAPDYIKDWCDLAEGK